MKKIIFLIFLIIIIGGGIFAYKTYDETVNYVARIEEPVTFTVSEGDTFTSLLTEFEELNLVRNPQIIQIYLRLNTLNPAIKTGEYRIESDVTLTELVSILEKGVFKPGIRITLKEGLRSDQAADALEASLGTEASFNKSEFLNFINNPDFSLLKAETALFYSTYIPSGKPLEGFIFPDTYEFLPEQTTIHILETILSNFITRVTAEIDLENLNLNQSQITTLYQAVTLGSIVEKEASGVDRKEVISSIFNNRLKDSIRLQSDATVNFVTKKNDAAPLISDTLIESPFNTYRSDGLPPTPINSPGLRSIVASLYPDSTNYYFFFHDDAGNSYLSNTYREHLIKVEQIRGFN